MTEDGSPTVPTGQNVTEDASSDAGAPAQGASPEPVASGQDSGSTSASGSTSQPAADAATADGPSSTDDGDASQQQGTTQLTSQSSTAAFTAGDGGEATRIGGLSVLKGLVLYGATLTFAGFYAYFIEQIVTAKAGNAPSLSSAMVTAAAALAGILGSAFALVIGTPTTATNEALAGELRRSAQPRYKARRGLWLWRLLSLEPGGKTRASYPLTFGIWAYAVVASAVAIVYFLNQSETPDAIKALATAFAGYVVAFMTAAYGLATKSASNT